MPHQPGVKEALLDWGLVVVEVPGWQTRGSSSFAPRGHVLHHDVITDQPGTHDSVPPIIIDGRSDLPGPLANFWLERDGDVHLCAAGRANHAGEGGWKGLDSNGDVWGTEMNNLGVPSDEWPEPQLEAMARLAAATADYSGFTAATVCGHKEWAPTRKIDPHTIDMSSFRRWVELETKEGLSVADVAKIVTKLDRLIEVTINQTTRQIKAELNRELREAKRDNRNTDEITAAIKAADDEAADEKAADEKDR